MNENTYRDLVVWQKSMDLVDMVYGYIRMFPKDERFRLCDQLSRAVVSIPSNIAEGNGRSSRADYAHFLSIARGSLYETMTQLEVAKRQGYINDYSIADSLADEIRRMLTAMISKLTDGVGNTSRFSSSSRPTPSPLSSRPTPSPLSSRPTPSPSSL